MYGGYWVMDRDIEIILDKSEMWGEVIRAALHTHQIKIKLKIPASFKYWPLILCFVLAELFDQNIFTVFNFPPHINRTCSIRYICL